MKNLNVLLVDDSATMRAMIRRILSLCGVSVDRIYEAANGQEGLGRLKDQGIDLVIADLNMPVMGGKEMVEQLRKLPEHQQLPVIIISSETSEPRITQITAQGIDFIHKPFTPERVRSVIQKVVLKITGGNENACS